MATKIVFFLLDKGMLLFCSVIFERSLCLFYAANDHQTSTALNIAALRYKDGVIQ
jgi:hypothetical protein